MTDEPAEKVPEASTIYPPNAVHMMRTAQLAQLQLSAMADAKASLLMGATFVIFTITLGQARGGPPPLPLLILGGAAFFAAIFAVLAVIPMTSARRKGGAAQHPVLRHVQPDGARSEFLDEVTARLRTEDSIYRTMARDVLSGGIGAAGEEIPDAGLGLSHLPARAGGERRGLRVPVSLKQEALRAPTPYPSLPGRGIISGASPAPDTSRRSP